MAERTYLPQGAILRFSGESYRIQKMIGSGGTALLYSVEELDPAGIAVSRKHFVLKELFPAKGFCRSDNFTVVLDESETHDSPAILAHLKMRMQEEANVGQEASNTNYRVVPVRKCFSSALITLDTGETLPVDNMFCIMDDVSSQGCSLLEYMEKNQHPVHISEAIKIMCRILEAYRVLHVTHIHGDVQAGNIFIMDSEEDEASAAFILDFGSALELEENGQISYDGIIFSSDGYAPPEHFRNGTKLLTPASDIYGLGYIFLSLLKSSPWVAPSKCRDITRYFAFNPAAKTVINGQQIGIEDPATLRLLNRILQKSMAHDPSDRFPNAAVFLEAILQLEDCQNLTAKYGFIPDLFMHASWQQWQEYAEQFPLCYSPVFAKSMHLTEIEPKYRCEGTTYSATEILETAQKKNVLLYAENGCGKTLFLSKLFHCLTEDTHKIPIYLGKESLCAICQQREDVVQRFASEILKTLLPKISAEERISDFISFIASLSCGTFLVLLDDVNGTAAQDVLAALSAAFPQLQFIITTEEKPINSDLSSALHCIFVQVEPFSHDTVLQAVNGVLGRPVTTYEKLSLEEYYKWLQKPFVLFRLLDRLEAQSQKDLTDFPMTVLLRDYFSEMERKSSLQSKTESFSGQLGPLGRMIAKIAFAMLKEKTDAFDQNWLSSVCDLSVEDFLLANSVFKVIVPTGTSWRETQEYSFKDETVMSYFAAEHVASLLLRTIEHSDVRYLESVNYKWDCDAFGRAVDLVAGSGKREFYNELFQLLITDSMISERYASKIPYNAFRQYFEDSGVHTRPCDNSADVPYLEEELAWIRLAARFRQPEALFLLGDYYACGFAVPQNYEKAFECHLLAATEGDRASMRYLVHAYTIGLGVAKDPEAAAHWKNKATSFFVICKEDVAETYAITPSVRDMAQEASFYEESVDWLEQLSAQGYAPAKRKLGQFYLTGSDEDIVHGIALLTQAADLGDREAVEILKVAQGES